MATKQELIDRARERSEGSSGIPTEWGEPVELEEETGLFLGRFRGKAIDTMYEPAREVYLLWDEDGQPCFMRHRFRLGSEMDRVKPMVGDTIVIARGTDYVTKSGNGGHAYGVETEPCADPLPDTRTPAPAAAGADRNIPF